MTRILIAALALWPSCRDALDPPRESAKVRDLRFLEGNQEWRKCRKAVAEESVGHFSYMAPEEVDSTWRAAAWLCARELDLLGPDREIR